MNDKEISTYCSLIEEKGYIVADQYKNSLLPKYIYKYISLSNNENENKKRFDTLKNQSIWCSPCEVYNDPFEFRAVYFDEEQMKTEGYTSEQVGYVKEFYKQQRRIMLVCSFSGEFNSMPMWAHYANNHQGFCIRYEIKEEFGDKIFPVLYTTLRINAHNKVNELLNEINRANKEDLPPTEKAMKLISYMYLIFSEKHSSWEYENEFRVIYSKKQADDELGRSINCNVCGIKPDSIIAGYNCNKKHIEKLVEISKELGLKELSQMKLVENREFRLHTE